MIQIRRRTAVLATVAFVISTAIGVTALVRTANAGDQFTDTPPWIATHAQWLKDNGISDGFPDGTFRPNNIITRGQAAFWMGNYNNAIELVRGSTDLTNPTSGFGDNVFCPAGKRAVAGGGETSNNQLYMSSMVPFKSPTGSGLKGWAVVWRSVDGTPQVPGFTTIWALCIPDTIPPEAIPF